MDALLGSLLALVLLLVVGMLLLAGVVWVVVEIGAGWSIFLGGLVVIGLGRWFWHWFAYQPPGGPLMLPEDPEDDEDDEGVITVRVEWIEDENEEA